MTRDQLVAARLNSGHSIRGLARRLGIHEQVVRRVESGEPIRPESAKLIADFYGVTVTELLGIDTEAAA